MNIKLDKDKIDILSKLIKKGSLTLEEAIILLKEEDDSIDNQEVITSQFDSWCTSVSCSTWNTTVSYVTYDETPTL